MKKNIEKIIEKLSGKEKEKLTEYVNNIRSRNSRLKKTIETYKENEKISNFIEQKITGTLDLNQLFHDISSEISDKLEFDGVFLALTEIQDNKEYLTGKYLFNSILENEECEKIRKSYKYMVKDDSQSAGVTAINSKNYVYISNIEEDEKAKLKTRGMGSYITWPMQ